jgi:hypothetical protein
MFLNFDVDLLWCRVVWKELTSAVNAHVPYTFFLRIFYNKLILFTIRFSIKSVEGCVAGVTVQILLIVSNINQGLFMICESRFQRSSLIYFDCG